MATSLDEGRPRSVGQFIRLEQSRIIQAWQAAVEAQHPFDELPGPVLRDEMPDVVDAIAALVDAPEVLAKEPAPAEAAQRHAIQRLGIGYEIAHVLLEFSVLRSCIFQVIARERTLGVNDLILLNAAVDAVANRGVERFSKSSERLLKAVDRISEEALASVGVDDLLERLLGVLMQASNSVDSVAILLKQDDGRLYVRAAVGLIREREAGFSVAVGEGFAGTIAARGTPMLLRSAARDPLVASEFIRERGIQALYGVPLRESEVIGVAHMGSLTVNDFTNEEKLLFQAMVTRASAAIVHAQLAERERSARLEAERSAQKLEAEHDLLVATVQQMPIGVLLCDVEEGRALAVNQVFERLWGGPPPGARLDAQTAQSLFHPEGRSYAAGEWPLARALAGEDVHDQVMCLARGEGQIATLRSSAKAIRDRGGRVVAGVLVVEDITERAQVEAERELFLSTLSHDLRSPLSVLQLTADSLSKTAQPAQAMAIGRLAATVERMSRLTQQLLDMAMSRRGGGIPVARQTMDLRALCRQVIDAFHVTHPDQPVVLSAPTEAIGSWDPDRLAQLVQNLVANALEHGLKGEPVVVAIEAGAGETWLRVTNRNEHGPITEELRPHLFDPFRRSGERAGLGLGLYICRQIAVAHGGDIEVASDERETRFTVRLPDAGPRARRP